MDVARDGLPRLLRRHRWPAGRGSRQFYWEPKRTVRGLRLRSHRLTALGNAVVPWCAALAWTVLRRRVAAIRGY